MECSARIIPFAPSCHKMPKLPRIDQRTRGGKTEIKVIWNDASQGQWHYVPEGRLKVHGNGELFPGQRVSMTWRANRKVRTRLWEGTVAGKQSKAEKFVSKELDDAAAADTSPPVGPPGLAAAGMQPAASPPVGPPGLDAAGMKPAAAVCPPVGPPGLDAAGMQPDAAGMQPDAAVMQPAAAVCPPVGPPGLDAAGMQPAAAASPPVGPRGLDAEGMQPAAAGMKPAAAASPPVGWAPRLSLPPLPLLRLDLCSWAPRLCSLPPLPLLRLDLGAWTVDTEGMQPAAAGMQPAAAASPPVGALFLDAAGMQPAAYPPIGSLFLGAAGTQPAACTPVRPPGLKRRGYEACRRGYAACRRGYAACRRCLSSGWTSVSVSLLFSKLTLE